MAKVRKSVKNKRAPAMWLVVVVVVIGIALGAVAWYALAPEEKKEAKEVKRVDLRIHSIYPQILEDRNINVPENRTVVTITIFLTNEGNMDSGVVEVYAFAEDTGTGISYGTQQWSVDTIRANTTEIGNLDLELPNGYTYKVYLEILENHKAIMRGTGTITLKGTPNSDANPFRSYGFEEDYNHNVGVGAGAKEATQSTMAGMGAGGGGLFLLFLFLFIVLVVVVPIGVWAGARRVKKAPRQNTSPYRAQYQVYTPPAPTPWIAPPVGGGEGEGGGVEEGKGGRKGNSANNGGED